MWFIVFLFAALMVADVDNKTSFFERENAELRVVVIAMLLIAGLIAYYIESRYDK